MLDRTDELGELVLEEVEGTVLGAIAVVLLEVLVLVGEVVIVVVVVMVEVVVVAVVDELEDEGDTMGDVKISDDTLLIAVDEIKVLVDDKELGAVGIIVDSELDVDNEELLGVVDSEVDPSNEETVDGNVVDVELEELVPSVGITITALDVVGEVAEEVIVSCKLV